MGHSAVKDVYHQVGEKLNELEVRAPMNLYLYEILKEIFNSREAEIFCKMPFSLSTVERISQISKIEIEELKNILNDMSSKGLVLDLFVNGENQYSPSPMVIGIFEFTMMRTGKDVNSKRLAELFHHYLGDETFFSSNYKNGERISPLRTMPYEDAIYNGQHTEILDYEKAYAIVEKSKKFAIGLCSCRHEKHHTGDKECDIKLDTCSTFDIAADSLIRNGLAKEVTKKEAIANLEHSYDNGLIIMADNVKKNIFFMCHCCGCCCNALAGLSQFGYPNSVVTSNYIASINEDYCVECGTCVEACPINAIEMVEYDGDSKPKIDEDFCLGCGVCSLQCANDAMRLVSREKRVLHPENTFERIILQCLEKGTLQNQLFDDQSKMSLRFMSGLVGGFLRLPTVKKALMSDLMRSRFLSMMQSGIKMQGKGWLLEL
ncbi:4Fe-4S dicluster domain-containing protein [Candidatus Thorarchaeota archaeon]|nr:MAG: 4Fe-4S dicluster domain-containing protein [Candidatus Thorarchaeota archaeon]